MSSQQQSAEGHALGPRAKKLWDYLKKEKVTDELVFTASTAKEAAKAIGTNTWTTTYQMLRAIEKAGLVELTKLKMGEGISIKFVSEPKPAAKAPRASRAKAEPKPRKPRAASSAAAPPPLSPSQRLLREAKSQLELEIKVIDREIKKKERERKSKIRQLGQLNQVLGKEA